MYGTVARIRVKPGMEGRMADLMRQYESLNIPGFIGTYIYRMDADPNEFYMAVTFDSKDSYFANANDPAQDARYRQMLEILASAPEWHDGEIAYTVMASQAQR